MKKILDIFSYVSEKELPLATIEQAFDDVVNSRKKSVLKFSFVQQVQREDMQGAINELLSENKEVVVAKMNGEEVVILGYIDK